jgi:hypothetical protein
LRLGVKLWNPVMTENEIVKEIVDAAFRIPATPYPSGDVGLHYARQPGDWR